MALADQPPSAFVRAEEDLLFAMHRMTWRVNRGRVKYHTEDRLLDRLEHDPPARRVLLADHPTSLPTAAVRRVLEGATERPAHPSVTVTSPYRLRRLDPRHRGQLERTYRRLDLALRRAARRNGMARPHVLTTNSLLAAFADLRWAAGVTLYATDDFAAAGRAPELYRWAYETLPRRPDVRIAAVSPFILERMGRPDGVVLPNGLDPSEWVVPHAAPSWYTALPAPRLLYVGGLTARLDVEAVLAAAREVPEGSVVLIGQAFDEAHLAPLRRAPNVTIHDVISREEVMGVLRASDVGLVPHVINDSTLAMNPLKAYEYVAAGLPVVASPLPAMRTFGPGVLLAETVDFGRAARRALELPAADPSATRAFLAEHSWRGRHDRLFRLAFEGR